MLEKRLKYLSIFSIGNAVAKLQSYEQEIKNVRKILNGELDS